MPAAAPIWRQVVAACIFDNTDGVSGPVHPALPAPRMEAILGIVLFVGNAVPV